MIYILSERSIVGVRKLVRRYRKMGYVPATDYFKHGEYWGRGVRRV